MTNQDTALNFRHMSIEQQRGKATYEFWVCGDLEAAMLYAVEHMEGQTCAGDQVGALYAKHDSKDGWTIVVVCPTAESQAQQPVEAGVEKEV